MKQTQEIHIFSDFDGTITSQDVGVLILDRFSIGNWRKYEDMVNEISIRTMLTKEWELFRGTKNNIKIEILPKVSLTKGFKEFLDYIKGLFPFTIVSDGFHFYINELLADNGIEADELSIIANKLVESEQSNTVTLDFNNAACEHGCANCKASHILKAKNNGKRVIYIGDGLSDIIPATQADVVFAKKNKALERHFKEKQLDFTPYNTFTEILSWFKEQKSL